MIELLNDVWNYVQVLGEKHNVNPVIFGALYIGSIPPYLGALGWLVRNLRQNKPVAIPILSTLFFFILPSGYILVFGINVAWWVYVIVAVLIFYGAYTAYKKVRIKLQESV